MAIPKVAIVGRPNVGKSSIFNWLIGKRVAIVDPTSGVTRDRLTQLAEHEGRYFELTDTGGMGIEDRDGLTSEIERQIQRAIDEATLIILVTDGRTGITDSDRLVAKRLRSCGKPVLYVANKCDNDQYLGQATESYKLGRELIFTSVLAGRNKHELLAAIIGHLPDASDSVDADVVMKLAVVGKRNAGKSTFINWLAQSERMITSEVPGTTRDSVDVRFEHHGQPFIAIDTAGVRRKKSLADDVEFYSLVRAQRTIRQADVVLLLLDPTTQISKTDKQLTGYVFEHHKPCIFAVNKWDLMVPMATGRFDEYISSSFPNLSFAPRVFLTAKTGRNVQALVDLTQSLFEQSRARITTGELNRVVQEALQRNPPPVRRNRRPKIFYATQIGTAPPTIVLFCNAPRSFDATYQRYLINIFRDELPFPEIPIKLHFRRRDSHTLPEDPGDSNNSGKPRKPLR